MPESVMNFSRKALRSCSVSAGAVFSFDLKTAFLYGAPPLGGGFQKAYSFAHVSKTPFDLLKSLAVWQLRVNKSKGGHDG